MAIARVSAHDGNGASGSATFGILNTVGSLQHPTSGNLLLCLVPTTVSAPTISGWTQIASTTNGFVDVLTLFAKTADGTEGTVTPSSGSLVAVCEYSGVPNPYVLDGTAAGASATSGTSLQSANITTSQSGSLIILAGVASNASSTSWTTSTKIVATIGGQTMALGQYLPGSVQTNFHDTFSWTGSSDNVVLIAAFKPPVSTLAGMPLVVTQTARTRASHW